MWKVALPCILWAIWKERNRVVFDNDSFSPTRLKHSFITSLTSWAGIIYEGVLYCKLAYVYSLVLLAAFVLGGWYMSFYSSFFCFSFLCILPVYSRV